MNAYTLESGEILYPRRLEGAGGLIGDGWGLAAPGSSDFIRWKAFTSPATPGIEAMAAKLRTQRDGQAGR